MKASRKTTALLPLSVMLLSLSVLIGAAGDDRPALDLQSVPNSAGQRMPPNFAGPQMILHPGQANPQATAGSFDPAELLIFSDDPDLARAKQELLRRGHLLADAHFAIPVDLYRLYLIDQGKVRSEAPVAYIAADAVYRISADAQRQAELTAQVQLEVFAPELCGNTPILTAGRDWLDFKVNGKGAVLGIKDGFVRFTPPSVGTFTITARSRLGRVGASGSTVRLGTIRTTRTIAAFDSPQAWQFSAAGDNRRLVGDQAAGTHGQLALSPRESIEMAFEPPAVRSAHGARYELRGDIAWNQDASVQQVWAALQVNITGDGSDRIELTFPPGAQRVSVTGSEIREAQVSPGAAVVHLQGKVAGATTLSVSYELPAGGDTRTWGAIGVRDGYWRGGTIIMTNSAGGSELVAGGVSGLKEMALADVPQGVAGLSPSPAVLAYSIVGREFSASIDVLKLGQFALAQSIADLAHYEIYLGRDGAMMVRARYEIRNRSRQFVRVDLPAGATVLLSKVNERATPLTAVADRPAGRDSYLLRLERSRTSVMGMTSFPMEIVYTLRRGALGEAGSLELPLPGIDLSIAYAWGEAYLPPELEYKDWTGALRQVLEFTSRTAKGTLDYGYAAQAEKEPAKPVAKPPAPRINLLPVLIAGAADSPAQPSSQPVLNHAMDGEAVLVRGALAKNYYRAGVNAYDRGDFSQAARSFQNTLAFAPDSVEADNAKKLLANPQMAPTVTLFNGQQANVAVQSTTQPRQAQVPQPGQGVSQAGFGMAAQPGKSSPALGSEVKKELSEMNRSLRQTQDDLVNAAMEDVRKGDLGFANARLSSAKALNDKLLSQGESPDEINARMGKFDVSFEQARKDAQQKVAILSAQVDLYEKQGSFDRALDTVKQLRQLSNDAKLDTKLDVLAAKAATQQDKGAKNSVWRTERQSGIQDSEKLQAQETREMEIPWYEYMKYPKDWRDITAARGDSAPAAANETEADRLVRQKLRTRIPRLDFTDLQFRDAAEFFRTASGVNFNVNWEALAAAGVDKTTTINLNLNDVTVDKAFQLVLQDLSTKAKIGYLIDNGVVKITTQEDLAKTPVVRAYDIRDLVVRVPNFAGAVLSLTGGANNNASGSEGNLATREELVTQITDIIKATIDKDSWTPTGTVGPISEINGSLIVTQTAQNHEKVLRMLEGIRANRGPNVDAGQQLARQQTGANTFGNLVVGDRNSAGNTFNTITWDGGTNLNVKDEDVSRFLQENYGWRIRNAYQAWDSDAEAQVVQRLFANAGQTVPVTSFNGRVSDDLAARLGVKFQTGVNDLRYAIIDEAQFSTLMELQTGDGIDALRRGQLAVVGSDALLANGMTGRVLIARDRDNTVDVNGNTIPLAHESYLLIHNGDSVTVMRAGAVRFFTDKADDRRAEVEVPLNIDVPRVGQRIRFEKTLLEPTDKAVLRALTIQKGK